MKIILYIIIGLVLLVSLMFFILGKKSQSGHAPGLVAGKLAPCPSSPNCVSSEAGTAEKKLVDAYPVNWDGLVSALEQQSNATITSNVNGYLSAEFKSKTFGFVDDFEARLDGDKIQIRSASRVGYSDRGVNRARVENLHSLLTAKQIEAN